MILTIKPLRNKQIISRYILAAICILKAPHQSYLQLTKDRVSRGKKCGNATAEHV